MSHCHQPYLITGLQLSLQSNKKQLTDERLFVSCFFLGLILKKSEDKLTFKVGLIILCVLKDMF